MDGTLVYQPLLEKRNFLEELVQVGQALPGAVDRLKKWRVEGNKVVITTARPWVFEELTRLELDYCDLEYDLLIMDCGTGPRLVINNFQPDSTVPMARSANVDVNSGIDDIEI